jgi:peptidoglycan/LPS O-acetylase OafA/YrhL
MFESTQSGKVFYPQLDALRAIAVMLVIISHWFSEKHFLNRYTANGSLGVTLFFVLSGFLITGILLNSKANVEHGGAIRKAFSTFYARRSLRIFPVYYVLLFALVLFNVASARQSFFWHLFYGSNFYFWLLGKFEGSLSHFWTLAVEEQFYLLWPAVILLVPRRYLQPIFLLGITGAALFRFLITTPQNPLAHLLMPGSLDSFCIGGLLAYGRQPSSDWYKWYKRKRSYFLLYALLSLVFVQTGLFRSLGLRTTAAFSFLFMSIAFGILIDRVADNVRSKPLQFFLDNPGVLYLGKVSYGVYLFHNFIPYFYHLYFPPVLQTLSPYIIQLSRFLLLMTVASLSWFLLEKPLLRLKDRFVYEPGPGPAAPR